MCLNQQCGATVYTCLLSYACESPTCQDGCDGGILVQVMMVLMHNTREVPAEWQIKAPADAGAAVDWLYFKCEPEQGLLPPGQKQLLKVSLTRWVTIAFCGLLTSALGFVAFLDPPMASIKCKLHCGDDVCSTVATLLKGCHVHSSTLVNVCMHTRQAQSYQVTAALLTHCNLAGDVYSSWQ